MQKQIAVTACIALLALAAPAGSAWTLEALDPQPAHIGNDVGCDDASTGWSYGAGAAGVPSGPCTMYAQFTSAVTHSYVECAAYCYASIFGYDPATWQSFSWDVYCPSGGSILVDWDLGQHVHVAGSCINTAWGTLTPTDVPWTAYYGSQSGIKFVHSDNIVDVLLH